MVRYITRLPLCVTVLKGTFFLCEFKIFQWLILDLLSNLVLSIPPFTNTSIHPSISCVAGPCCLVCVQLWRPLGTQWSLYCRPCWSRYCEPGHRWLCRRCQPPGGHWKDARCDETPRWRSDLSITNANVEFRGINLELLTPSVQRYHSLPEWSLSIILNMISMSVLYLNRVSVKFGATLRIKQERERQQGERWDYDAT